MKKESKRSILRLYVFGSRYIVWLLMTFFFSLAGIALTILSSLYLGRLSEKAIAMDFELFFSALVPMVVIFLLQTPLAYINTYASTRFAEYTIFDFRNCLTGHVHSLPLAQTEKNTGADILSRLNSDVGLIQHFLHGSMLQLIVQPLTFFACAAYLFYLSFELSLVSFTAVPVFMAITLLISKPLERYSKEVQEAVADMTGIAQSVISGMPEAKSFNLEKPLGEKFDKAVNRSVMKGLLLSKISAIINPANAIMQSAPFLLVYAYGGHLVVSGAMSFGDLIVFINLSNAVVSPLHIMPQAIGAYRIAKGACVRVFELLDFEKEKSGVESTEDLHDEIIRLEDVCFAYEGNEPLFSGLNMCLKKGEITALAGPSGCGKSTVLKLIAGFYMPHKGEVKVGEISTKLWDIEKLRSNIALVTQDTYLFPCSIFENIEYGKPGADPNEVYEAAKVAGIHEFVLTLPEGYDTLVGERGVKLSGGQKQRVSIARAILKDAPILLMDEATSSLDAETEHYVQKSLEVLMKKRTVLVVAHRLSSIKAASKIYVLDEGTVKYCGSHDELIESSELYKRLFSKQVNPEKREDANSENIYSLQPGLL